MSESTPLEMVTRRVSDPSAKIASIRFKIASTASRAGLCVAASAREVTREKIRARLCASGPFISFQGSLRWPPCVLRQTQSEPPSIFVTRPASQKTMQPPRRSTEQRAGAAGTSGPMCCLLSRPCAVRSLVQQRAGSRYGNSGGDQIQAYGKRNFRRS
jgi:hypothetical protein